MSAYKDALQISSAEVGSRLQLAADLLATGTSVVLLDGSVALRAGPTGIMCEVISSGSVSPEAQVQNAKRLLHESTVRNALQGRTCHWLVVEDYGTGTLELWRES